MSPAPEALSLSALNELAKVYAHSHASPHHFTLGVEALRELIKEVFAAQGDAAHGSCNGNIPSGRCGHCGKPEDLTTCYATTAQGDAAQEPAAIPQGYKLVPITHTVNRAAWDRMCLAVRAAMTHEGFNEPSDIAAAKAWHGNTSHLIRSIIAACPDGVNPSSNEQPKGGA